MEQSASNALNSSTTPIGVVTGGVSPARSTTACVSNAHHETIALSAITDGVKDGSPSVSNVAYGAEHKQKKRNCSSCKLEER